MHCNIRLKCSKRNNGGMVGEAEGRERAQAIMFIKVHVSGHPSLVPRFFDFALRWEAWERG